ncbi:MAG: DUF47 family protein [Bryobacterales bacterium]|nr:DUF47 family protein [Bryobacterales bacterium]
MQIQPKDFNIFRDLLVHFNLVQSAFDTLKHCGAAAAGVSSAFARIQGLEKEGDELLRNATRQLDRQLTDYPPRENTRRMFYQQDRILDAAEHLAGRLAAYRLEELPDHAVQFMALIGNCTEVLGEALRAFGEARRFVGEMGRMTDLENQADQLYISAIGDLAEHEDDPRRMIMLHETYSLLERIVNLFEDCIQTMEDAAIRTLSGR